MNRDQRIVVVSRSREVREQCIADLSAFGTVEAYPDYDAAMDGLYGGASPQVFIVHMQGQPLHGPRGTTFYQFDHWLARTRAGVPVIYLRRKGTRTLEQAARVQTRTLLRLPVPGAVLVEAVRPLLAAPLEGPVTLDVVAHELSYGGRTVGLTRMESHLLAYLRAQAGRVCGPEELLVKVWLYQNPEAASTLVRAHVSNLRRRLERVGLRREDLVQTVRGVGYRWRPDERLSEATRALVATHREEVAA